MGRQNVSSNSNWSLLSSQRSLSLRFIRSAFLAACWSQKNWKTKDAMERHHSKGPRRLWTRLQWCNEDSSEPWWLDTASEGAVWLNHHDGIKMMMMMMFPRVVYISLSRSFLPRVYEWFIMHNFSAWEQWIWREQMKISSNSGYKERKCRTLSRLKWCWLINQNTRNVSIYCFWSGGSLLMINDQRIV